MRQENFPTERFVTYTVKLTGYGFHTGSEWDEPRVGTNSGKNGRSRKCRKRKKAVLLRQPLAIESKIVISLMVTALKPRGRTSLQGKPSQLAALPLR